MRESRDAGKPGTPGADNATPASDLNKNMLAAMAARVADMKKTLMAQVMTKAARTFNMPYTISATAFKAFEDDFQYLAVGLIDGAIVIIDLILGVEKHFLEKHPAAISAMDFFEDKCLISGSIDGRINLSDIENLDKKKKVRFQKMQNTMDRKIPVVNVACNQEFGIGMAVDVEGNCRFYDLIRFKKMAKVACATAKEKGSVRF